MKQKILPLSLCIAGVLLSNQALAEAEWGVHGYMSSNYRMAFADGGFQSFDGTLGGSDYRAIGSQTDDVSNQVEFTVNRFEEHDNELTSNYVLRAEYGNPSSYFHSSSGGERQDDVVFEVKEAFVELGLNEDTTIWAGQRFLNRSAGILSGEFWKQSSGVGAGLQSKLMGKTAGVAIVSADPGDGAKTHDTLTSLNLWMHGISGFDIDFKYIVQANIEGQNEANGTTFASDGIGASLTYNSSWYGLDGWAQTGLAYGTGLAANRGVNFGNWSAGWEEDSSSLFFTSYGVANLTSNLQLGTEITYWGPSVDWGLKVGDNLGEVSRLLIGARPSYKVNDYMRFEVSASYSMESVTDGAGNAGWGRTEDSTSFYSVELAPVFTVNNDFFGRPQLKPYIGYVGNSEDNGSTNYLDGKNSQITMGVHAEIWF